MTKEAPTVSEVSELEFVVEHTIHATPERIFDAYTKRELITKWWSHPGKTMRIETMDVWPGGKWRFAYVDGDGAEMVMHGAYQEVDPVTRLSYTYNNGEGNQNEILATVDIEPVGAGSRVTLTNRCQSKEQRDMLLSYGAKAGAMAALKNLEAMLQRT